jgi:hypothetical protein
MENMNKRHIAQIIRRNTITKVKPSGKNYTRKEKHKGKDNLN